MHAVIMNTVGTEKLVDHKDHNGLNNQKSNLRVCTKSENMANRYSVKGSSSSFLGVSMYVDKRNIKKNIKWVANIRKNNKTTFLGYFQSEIEAAKAYNKKAKELHGEFARLNIIPKKKK